MYVLSDKKALYPLATETPRTKARRNAEQLTCPQGVAERQARPTPPPSVPGAGWCSRSAPRSGAGGGTGEVSRLQPAGDGALRLRGKWRWDCLTGVCHTRGEAVILLLSIWVNPLPLPPPPPCQYVFWDTGEGGAFLKDILSREKRRCASLYSGHNLKMKRIPLSLQGITQTCFSTGSWISSRSHSLGSFCTNGGFHVLGFFKARFSYICILTFSFLK